MVVQDFQKKNKFPVKFGFTAQNRFPNTSKKLATAKLGVYNKYSKDYICTHYTCISPFHTMSEIWSIALENQLRLLDTDQISLIVWKEDINFPTKVPKSGRLLVRTSE